MRRWGRCDGAPPTAGEPISCGPPPPPSFLRLGVHRVEFESCRFFRRSWLVEELVQIILGDFGRNDRSESGTSDGQQLVDFFPAELRLDLRSARLDHWKVCGFDL